MIGKGEEQRRGSEERTLPVTEIVLPVFFGVLLVVCGPKIAESGPQSTAGSSVMR